MRLARDILITTLVFSLAVAPAVAGPIEQACLLGMNVVAQADPQGRVNEVREGIPQAVPGETKPSPGKQEETGQFTLARAGHDIIPDHIEQPLTYGPSTAIVTAYMLYRLGQVAKRQRAAQLDLDHIKRTMYNEPYRNLSEKDIAKELETLAAEHGREEALDRVYTPELATLHKKIDAYEKALKDFERALVEADEPTYRAWVRDFGVRQRLLLQNARHPVHFTIAETMGQFYLRKIAKARKAHQRQRADRNDPELERIRQMTEEEFELWASRVDADHAARMAEARQNPETEETAPPASGIEDARAVLERTMREAVAAAQALHDHANGSHLPISRPVDPFRASGEDAGYALNPLGYLGRLRAFAEQLPALRHDAENRAGTPEEALSPYDFSRPVRNTPRNLRAALNNAYQRSKRLLYPHHGLPDWREPGWVRQPVRFVGNTARVLWHEIKSFRHLLVAGGASFAIYYFHKLALENEKDKRTAVEKDEILRSDPEAAVRGEDTIEKGAVVLILTMLWSQLQQDVPDLPNFPIDITVPAQAAALENLFDEATKEAGAMRARDPERFARDEVYEVERFRLLWHKVLDKARKDNPQFITDLPAEEIFGENQDGQGGLVAHFATASAESLPRAREIIREHYERAQQDKKLGRVAKEDLREMLDDVLAGSLEGKLPPQDRITEEEYQHLLERFGLKDPVEPQPAPPAKQ